MARSKTTCPKWDFGQVGHGGKKDIWEFFITKIPNKKIMISYSEQRSIECSRLQHEEEWGELVLK
jgi:hypothetical protein